MYMESWSKRQKKTTCIALHFCKSTIIVRKRLLKTTDRKQINISWTNIGTTSSIIDTQTEVSNTKISKVDQNDLVIAYYCPSCAIPATPDHKGIVDCSRGLMATKEKRLTNGKLFVGVVSGSVEINLQVNLSMLISCYGIHSAQRSLQSQLQHQYTYAMVMEIKQFYY